MPDRCRYIGEYAPDAYSTCPNCALPTTLLFLVVLLPPHCWSLSLPQEKTAPAGKGPSSGEKSPAEWKSSAFPCSRNPFLPPCQCYSLPPIPPQCCSLRFSTASPQTETFTVTTHRVVVLMQPAFYCTM